MEGLDWGTVNLAVSALGRMKADLERDPSQQEFTASPDEVDQAITVLNRLAARAPRVPADATVVGSTLQGREWSVGVSGTLDRCYPRSDSHTWGEFAGLAVEMGGYGDLTAIDPYTGRRFWLGSALRCDEHSLALAKAEPGDAAMAVYRQCHRCEACHASSVVTGIRRLLDAMEFAGFPDRFRADFETEPASTNA